MNIIHKQDSLAKLKQNLAIQQKIVFELEMSVITLEKEIADMNENCSHICDAMTLSPQQKEIVESIDKNILVVACPGSGKTHTVIARYVDLVINKNIDPSSIILITFTKKAGMEMNNRIQTILPNKLPYYVGSLHGLSFRLLQEFAKINSIVLNENESKYLIKQSANKILKNCNLLSEEENMIRMQIPYIYDKISTTYPANITEILNNMSISTKYKKIINDILKDYKLIKKLQNLIDFNDLMIQLCTILDGKKLNGFLEGIKYLFFDAYQDINPIQFYILKSFKTTNIMAVGDDAQSIYAFRGSSVKYIWDFDKDFNAKIYYLETNYRSTQSIVNLFQDTISHNTKQYKKSVISNNSIELIPHIKCHNTNTEQYIWIVEDIIRKQKEGVLLKDIVILARTNSSIEKIELELIKYSIPIIKSIGISLLNKNHIKDFIAFMIIVIGIKNHNISTIHLQRLLACHKHIGIVKANEMIDSIDCLLLIEKLKDELNELYEILTSINRKKPKEQIVIILQYLIKIWKENKEQNIDNMIQDINSIIIYMKNDTIEQFVNNLHLTIEIEHTDHSLFISTVHSAKGLEWEHVYIIDVTSKDFPSIKPTFYKNCIDNSEEERRLFYVACSRAKKYLTITTFMDIQNNISISPFIKELDSSKYFGLNMTTALAFSYKFTGYILKDCINYLRYSGYEKVIPIINQLEHTRIQHNIPNIPILGDRDIASKMMELLVYKMLQNNFPNMIKGFDTKHTNDTIYYNYIDKLTSWRNIIKDIFYMASYQHHNIDSVNNWKEYFMSINCFSYYTGVEKILVQYIKQLKPTQININYNCNKDPIKGSIDILIEGESRTMIELKCTPDDACTMPNISQLILYGYLLKKTIPLDKSCIFNLWNGTIDSINMKLIEISKFKKIIYS